MSSTSTGFLNTRYIPAFKANSSMSEDVQAVTAIIGHGRLHFFFRLSFYYFKLENHTFSIDLIEFATLNPSISGI